jgi:hypothetical protein
MSLSRIAFIIGDGHSGGDPLPGVAVDHKSWRRFLRSDGGGAWRSDEIVDIDTISAIELEGALSTGGAIADYALVVFSGHGVFGKENGRTYCCINSRETVADLELVTGAKKQLTIVASCRRVTSFTPLRKSGHTVLGAVEEDTFAKRYRKACRDAYDTQIAEADGGLSLAYACSRNETASDTSAGDLFLSSLIDTATAWVDETKGHRKLVHKWLSIADAFDATKRGMAAMRFPQHPIRYLGKRQGHFPFAVA